MKTRWVFLLVLSVLPCVVLAGPNAGGTLILHANPNIQYSEGAEYCGQSGLSSCDSAIVSLPFDPGVTRVFHAIAAFPDTAQPRLMGVTFGIQYDAAHFVMADHGPCGSFELPSADWPDPGTGTAVTWSEVQTSYLVDTYWFAGYCYGTGSDSTRFELTAHPDSTMGGVFGDDAVPAALDPVAGYGTLGFGMPGSISCPEEQGSSGGPDEPGAPHGPTGPLVNCIPHVVIVRFAPDVISFPENPELHEHFTLPLSSAEFARSELDSVLYGLGGLTFETVAPIWRHMTREDHRDVSGTLVDLIDFTDVYRVTLDGTESVDQVISALSGRSDIEYAECIPEASYNPVDSLYDRQWYLDNTSFPGCVDVNAPEAWALQDSSGTKIGICDSQVNPWVPGLQGYVDTLLSRSFVSEPWWTTSTDLHGTHVASIAGTGTLDSFPLASIADLPRNHDDSLLVVLHTNNNDGVEQALSWVRGQIVGGRIRVVNFSWGSPACKNEHSYFSTTRDAFRNAFQLGINLVCSAGNDPHCSPCAPGDTCFNYPAAFSDYALAVGAVDSLGSHNPSYVHGSYVDIAAPGQGIYALDADGVRRLGWGTSYSAPLVTSSIALLLGADPSLTNEDCCEILQRSAQALPAPHLWVGAGLLDVAAAIDLVKGSHQVVHASTNVISSVHPDGDRLPVILRNVKTAGHTFVGEDPDSFLVDRYRLDWTVSLDPPDSAWIEHLWPRGRTCSGFRRIDESIDNYYDGKFYANHADLVWNLGSTATFQTYAYKIRDMAGDSLGWAPFDPYEPPDTAQVTYSYVLNSAFSEAVHSPRTSSRGGVVVTQLGDRILFRFDPELVATVDVAVYDISGRCVRMIPYDRSAAQQGEIVWDKRTGSGRRVPSGIYFAKLRWHGGGGQNLATPVRLVIVQ